MHKKRADCIRFNCASRRHDARSVGSDRPARNYFPHFDINWSWPMV
jgi:hypothetical protein